MPIFGPQLALSWLCLMALAALGGFPFAASGLGATALAALGARRSRGRLRVALANLAAIALILTAFEAGVGAFGPFPSFEARGRGEYFRETPELGYAPDPGARVTVTRRVRGSTLYRATYSIDEHGHRIAPTPARPGARAALFYGDSYTFGEGVNDAETYPARVQALSGGELRAINLAFSGYGPHQMLRSIELGLEQAALRGAKPAVAYYFALPDHPLRAAGKVAWGWTGPRYALDPSGTPRFQGPFHRGRWVELGGPLLGSYTVKWVLAAWSRLHAPPASGAHASAGALGPASRMAILSPVSSAYADEPAPARDPDTELFTAIIARSRLLLRERYGVELRVLFWRDGTRRDQELAAALRARGIHAGRIAELDPELLDHWERYTYAHDGHPTARGHDRIARLVLSDLARP